MSCFIIIYSCVNYFLYRLESYDRNDNFGHSDIQTSDYVMQAPTDSCYKDLHSGMKPPKLNMEKMTIYLDKFDKYLDKKGSTLYEEGFLRHIRMASDDNSCFLRSVCRAEMSKSVTYRVDLSLDNQGFVNEAQCECAAGMGPHAHCKHVCAVLNAVVYFSIRGEVVLEQTCTQVLQTFHHCKRYKGSPLKARNINMPGADDVTDFDFDPRPKKFQKDAGYSDYFRNTCLNFKGCSQMPLFQLFKPANAKAVAHDHDYFEKTHEDHFLDMINVTEICEKEAKIIEVRTQEQGNSKLWLEERLKRLCSSNFGRICKATERTDKKKLAETLTCPTDIKCAAILHGKQYEKEAVKKYEQDKNVSVKKCGMFVSKEKPYLAASPDGIIDSRHLVEVKCPYSSRNKEISPKTVPYLKYKDDEVTLDPSHAYYYQVQGQLYCADREVCDFVVYTITDVKYIRIKRDQSFINEMLIKLDSFFASFFKEAVLVKLYYRTMI